MVPFFQEGIHNAKMEQDGKMEQGGSMAMEPRK